MTVPTQSHATYTSSFSTDGWLTVDFSGNLTAGEIPRRLAMSSDAIDGPFLRTPATELFVEPSPLFSHTAVRARPVCALYQESHIMIFHHDLSPRSHDPCTLTETPPPPPQNTRTTRKIRYNVPVRRRTRETGTVGSVSVQRFFSRLLSFLLNTKVVGPCRCIDHLLLWRTYTYYVCTASTYFRTEYSVRTVGSD